MWLRWVANNIARSSARQKIAEAASKAIKSVTGSGAAERCPHATQIAFVFALGVESGGLVDQLQETVTTRCASFLEHAGRLQDRRVVIAESGVGAEAAAQTTADVIELHQPRWIISTGFASSLDESLRRADILMANEVKGEGDLRLALQLNVSPESIDETPSLQTGCLVSVDELVHTPEQRHELAERYQARACDMETLAVAKVCEAAGTRFLSIRLITENVDHRLPPEVEALRKQETMAGRMGAMAAALFKRPSSVKDVWKYKGEAMKASDRLARFLVGVTAQLEEPVYGTETKQPTKQPASTEQPTQAEQPQAEQPQADRQDSDS